MQNIFTAQRSLLIHWCKGIEETVLERHLPVVLYVGIQQLSNFNWIKERYQGLAELTGQVFVFSEHNVIHVPVTNIRFVELTRSHRLAQEWFLVVDHPDYSRAVIARKVSTSATSKVVSRYEGLLTSDKVMIGALHQHLQEVLEDND